MNRTFEAFSEIAKKYAYGHLEVPFELMQDTKGNMSLVTRFTSTRDSHNLAS